MLDLPSSLPREFRYRLGEQQKAMDEFAAIQALTDLPKPVVCIGGLTGKVIEIRCKLLTDQRKREFDSVTSKARFQSLEAQLREHALNSATDEPVVELRSKNDVLAVALHGLHDFYRDYVVFHSFTLLAPDVTAAARHASAILIIDPPLETRAEFGVNQ